MNELLGNKEEFAIEYSVDKSGATPFLKHCLWLNGLPIGALEDSVMLGTAVFAMEGLLKDLLTQSFNVPESASLEDIRNNGDLHDQLLTGLPESFDDFEKYVFRSGNDAVFLWQLVENPFFNYPNYPKTPQRAVIPMKSLVRVITSFSDAVSEHRSTRQSNKDG